MLIVKEDQDLGNNDSLALTRLAVNGKQMFLGWKRRLLITIHKHMAYDQFVDYFFNIACDVVNPDSQTRMGNRVTERG